MAVVKNDIVDRIKSGDSTAATELFINYRAKIITIVQQRLGSNNQNCEDICSEIEIALLINLREGKYDPLKGQLSAYIYGISLNKIREYYKSEIKRRSIFEDLSSEMIVNSYENNSEPAYHERQEIMRNAICSLQNKYKEVIYLRFYEEKSISEIAEHLQIESRRVSERIHYAITLLQKKC